ncbi:unnamed protein product [Vitrella brassicaformis CCMP3155]|uniref:Uncharacterized protein n=2 Tax=Vitrella brassicaformis TaxID=1169539 RepID=A0A0G4GVA5_VITBC|nr:unnamed protein product [Vitrella brassicaformis CCMP3155]|eukprot:CEM34804.1 unnamed protein product [Vitrella brassicaformis CCMP3155]
MSEVSKRQRRPAEGEKDDLEEGHKNAAASHSIDLEAFAQRFSQIPVVVAYVFSFLSLHLVAALPRRLWRHVGCQITQLVVGAYDTAERRFWCGLSFSDAFEWGRQLTRLESIIVEYPRGLFIQRSTPAGRPYGCDSRTLPQMSDKAVTALVEGHSEGQPSRPTIGQLHYSEGKTVTISEDEYRYIRAEREQCATLPLDPALTLTSITSITGIPTLCPGRGRHWQLPSLERVQIEGPVGAQMLGEVVATSRCLKQLQVECTPDVMADSLRCIPVTADGKSGPLSQLEDIGTLKVFTWRAAGLERLQAVLVDRGCRAIKELSVDLGEAEIDGNMFKTLSAIDTFTRTVCVSPGIPVDIKVNGRFNLSLVCEVPTRPAPSFFVQKHIQQLAAKSLRASFSLRPRHLTTPLDTPSTAAIALAECLTFPEVRDVVITKSHDWGPDADAEQPDPVMIDSMANNAFPAASSLSVHTCKGHVIARRLLSKMPAVRRIELTHPTEEQAVNVLQTVGGERELEYFHATWVKGVGVGGVTWGDMTDQLPAIERLFTTIEAPEDLGDGDAAGEFGITCVKTLLKFRGLKGLDFRSEPSDAFKRLVDERTNGNAIDGLEGRYDISWRGNQRDFLTLKRLDT